MFGQLWKVKKVMETTWQKQLKNVYYLSILPHEKGFKNFFIEIPDISESEINGGGVVMYAIIETGGKQYKVEQGDVIYIEKLDNEAGSTVEFDKVLAVAGDTMTVGNPIVSGAKVSGTVLSQGKSKKIVVFKYKAKKNERKKQGHRQLYTKVQIDEIKA